MKRRIRSLTGARRAGREVVRELALWLTAGVGLLVLAAAAALVAFGMKPLVFLSGSMEPHIGTGALALTTTTPGAELSEGDVISFLRSDGARVTHQITEITPEGNVYKVTTKGDANESDDPEATYLAGADRVFWHLEGAGAFVTEATQFKYVFPFGVLVGMTALHGFRRAPSPARPTSQPTAPQRETAPVAGRRPVPKRRRADMAAGGVMACAFTLAATGSAASAGTLAAFSDSGSQSAGYSSVADFLAPAVVDPETIKCSSRATLLGVDVTFAWQAPVGTVGHYATRLNFEQDPSRYSQQQSSNSTSVTYSLPTGLLYNGRYRFAIDAVYEGRTNGTAYRTVDYSWPNATCSWHDPAG